MTYTVSGRTLSNSEIVLGAKGDNAVEKIDFMIPRYTSSGVDLSLGIGYAVFRLPDGETDGQAVLTPTVVDDGTVCMTLLVGEEMTAQKGRGKLCLKISGLESAMWSSEVATTYVVSTIDMPSPQPFSMFRAMSVGSATRIATPESEQPLTITERAINIPAELQTIAVASDENSESVKIVVPRYFDGIDLSVYDFILHTEMAGNGADDILFNNQNGQMKSVEDSTVTLTWVLRPPQTSYEGKLSIQLFVQGESFAWHSLIGELMVAKHLVGDPVVPTTPSLYEQWLAEVSVKVEQAAQSATQAKKSATDAASSATEAASSATDAASSATDAASSATQAKKSATDAAGSATAASNSAQNAAQSAEDAKNWTPDFAVDSIWAARLNGENTSGIFQQYAAALAAQGVAVGDILRRWFTLLWDDNTYGVKFCKFDTSATSDGELIQSSAKLGAATPGTNTTEAQDPYFEHGAFWAVEVAYEIEDKEVAIKAVAGVNGVTRAALLSGQYGMVGVAQKTGWYADTEDDSYYYHYYRAAPANFVTDTNAYRPLPEGVALDGSVRPYVVHAKYMAGRGADGKLTSASGLAAVNFVSMQSQLTEWRKRGADYCGICGCDLSFRMRMFWMKYGKKGNSGTLEGCSNYNYQRIAKVSETGVKRVLLTASDASGYLVGSTVSVGDKGTGTSTDRGVASMRALADKVRILSIEDVQVNGTGYKALNLDAPAAFDTVAGETYISTMPWHSGSCDNVKGADGSPTSCTSGKEPFVLQLLECQPGGYAISADQLTEQVLTADAYTHRLVCFRQAAQIATSITSNAVRSPVVLTMPTNQAAAWLYQKDVEIDADGNMYAVAAGSPAGSTTGCRAAVYVPAAGSRVYAWWAWAHLLGGDYCGLSCGRASFSCGTASWAGLAGACGSGSNRGEYAG